MKALIQRISEAQVEVNGVETGRASKGILLLLCVEKEDEQKDFDYMCSKVLNMRIFSNEDGKFHYSLKDIEGDIMIVSQFTLAANIDSGRRPSFSKAEKPDIANEVYLKACDFFKNEGLNVSRKVPLDST